jgi:soluble lytic murein transglycosylase-like protein
MQLMPSTQDQFKVIDPFNPMASLDAGTKLLRQLLDRYHGDLSLALSAYNAGAGTVDRAGAIPLISETQSFVANILSRLGQ